MARRPSQSLRRATASPEMLNSPFLSNKSYEKKLLTGKKEVQTEHKKVINRAGRRRAELQNEVLRSILITESKSLSEIYIKVIKDLSLVKDYLNGEVNHREKESINTIMKGLLKNQIPKTWINRFSFYNLKFDTIPSFIKSFLFKIDFLYNISVTLRDNPPPVLLINRFLNPASFFTNLVRLNSAHYKVSPIFTRFQFLDLLSC